MKTYRMWIDGEWVEAQSGKTYTVVNPATEEEIAQVPLGGREEVDKAVKAARKAFPIWSKKTQAERCGLVNRIAAAFREHTRELAELDTLDHGTPIKKAMLGVSWAADCLEYAAQAGRALMGDVIPVKPGTMFFLQR